MRYRLASGYCDHMTTTAAAPRWATLYTADAFAALPADITTATPAQVDELIRTIELDERAHGERADRAIETIRRAVGQTRTDTRTGYGRDRRTVTTWSGTVEEALTTARANPAAEVADYQLRAYYDMATVADALAPLDVIEGELADMAAHLDRLAAEFDRRGGWTRYYRVDNSNGHVHKATSCRETYVTTQWNWPTQLSGADSAGVVAAAGALTCLTCFPEVRGTIILDRPIVPEQFETAEQRAERAKRDAENAVKRAAKIEKGVTPDGSPLTIELGPNHLTGFGRYLEVKTARAAELRYVELAALAQTRKTWITDADKAIAAQAAGELAAALAWKQGTTADAIVAKYAAKVTKKINDQY